MVVESFLVYQSEVEEPQTLFRAKDEKYHIFSPNPFSACPVVLDQPPPTYDVHASHEVPARSSVVANISICNNLIVPIY